MMRDGSLGAVGHSRRAEKPPTLNDVTVADDDDDGGVDATQTTTPASSATQCQMRRPTIVVIVLALVVTVLVTNVLLVLLTADSKGHSVSPEKLQRIEQIVSFINNNTLMGGTFTYQVDSRYPPDTAEERALETIINACETTACEGGGGLAPDSPSNRFRLLQQYAMLTLGVSGLNLPNGSFVSYDSLSDVCAWTGLTMCKEMDLGREIGVQNVVTTIFLDQYSTTGESPYRVVAPAGTLSPELGLLSKLVHFVLPSPTLDTVPQPEIKLNGTLPRTLELWTNLQTFNVSGNRLSGTWWPFRWKLLELLDLSENKFTGTIPDTLYWAENLKVFLAENNRLTGTIPSNFGSLNWHALHLNGNEFTGSIPPDLNSAQLEELYLHNNKLTGTFPANSFANDFAGESLLREVSLYNNNLEGRLDEMCYLVSYGKLQVFEVDLDKTPCQCCSPAPL
jgi:hypothetical protein